MVHAGSPEMENLYSLPLDNRETALVFYFSKCAGGNGKLEIISSIMQGEKHSPLHFLVNRLYNNL